MDVFKRFTDLDVLLSSLPQGDVLALAALDSDWPKLIAGQLRRLVLSPVTPIGVVRYLAGSFQRLREVVVDAHELEPNQALPKFWLMLAEFFERSRSGPQRVVLRNLDLLSGSAADHSSQLTFQAKMRFFRSILLLTSEPSLQQLHLQSIQIHMRASGALHRLCESLGTSSQALTTLCLKDCGLRNGVGDICSAISQGGLATQLQRLDLSLNRLGQPGAVSVARLLQFFGQLKSLSLASNALGPDGIMALAEGLPCVSSSLVELDLSENGMCSRGLEALVSTGLRLRILSLRKNWFGPDDAAVLCSVLQSMGDTLVRVDISENRLESTGMQRLLEGLPSLPELRALNLRQWQFATSAFMSAPFYRLSERAPLLEELNLYDCRLGTDTPALETVLSALPPHLKVLDVSASFFHDQNFLMLLKAVRTAPKLEKLNLVCARLDDAAAECLTTEINRDLQLGMPYWKLPCLRELNIQGNPLSKKAATRMLATLRQCSSNFKELKGMRTR